MPIPFTPEALAALKEVQSRFFAAEGHAEDAVVGAVTGAVSVVDEAHDHAMRVASGAVSSAIAALETIVNGEQPSA